MSVQTALSASLTRQWSRLTAHSSLTIATCGKTQPWSHPLNNMATLYQQWKDRLLASKIDALKAATRAAAGASVLDSATDPAPLFESLDQLIALHKKCADLISGHLASMAQPDL